MREHERQRIAKIFKADVEKALDELGLGYMVDLHGDFYTTPIRITIEFLPLTEILRRSLVIEGGKIIQKPY